MYKLKQSVFMIVLLSVSTIWAWPFSSTPKEKQDRACKAQYYKTVSEKLIEYNSIVANLENISGSTYCSSYIQNSRTEKTCSKEARNTSYQNAAAISAIGCGLGIIAAPYTFGNSLIIGCGGGLLAGGLAAQSTSKHSNELPLNMQNWSSSRKDRFESIKTKLKEVESEIVSINGVRKCMGFNGYSGDNDNYTSALRLASRNFADTYYLGQNCPVEELYQLYLNQTKSPNILSLNNFRLKLGRFNQSNLDINYCHDSTGKLTSFDEYVSGVFSSIDL